MGRRRGERGVLDQGRLLMPMGASPAKELGSWGSGGSYRLGVKSQDQLVVVNREKRA